MLYYWGIGMFCMVLVFVDIAKKRPLIRKQMSTFWRASQKDHNNPISSHSIVLQRNCSRFFQMFPCFQHYRRWTTIYPKITNNFYVPAFKKHHDQISERFIVISRRSRLFEVSHMMTLYAPLMTFDLDLQKVKDGSSFNKHCLQVSLPSAKQWTFGGPKSKCLQMDR